MGSTTKTTFDGSVYSVSYGLSFGPGSGSVIRSSDFTNIVNTLNTESSRRGQGVIASSPSGTITTSSVSGGFIALSNFSGTAPAVNTEGDSSAGTLITQLSGPWSGYGISIPGGIAQGSVIYASDITNLVGQLNSAGSQCVCNCNYCTCNCNYCTCNCDYSCTCNCNY